MASLKTNIEMFFLQSMVIRRHVLAHWKPV